MGHELEGRTNLPRKLTILLIGVALVAITATPAASASKCQATKLKSAGKKAACLLGLDAKAAKKGTASDPAKVQACKDKLSKTFAKADTGSDCTTSSDAGTIEDEVDSFETDVNGMLSPGAPPAASKCQAAKLTSAGKKAVCLLGLDAKAAKSGTASDPTKVQACKDKLSKSFAKADTGSDCTTTADAGTIEDKVDAFETAVVAALTGSVSLSGDVQPIFTAKCAVPFCHTGPSPQAGMDLSAGQSHAAVVDVASGECPAFKRVLPGDPAMSYLVFKIQGSGPCFGGSQMPLAQPPLSSAEMSTIIDWITEGAPNN